MFMPGTRYTTAIAVVLVALAGMASVGVPYSRVEADTCPIGPFGNQMVRSPQGDCVDTTPPSPADQQIIAAKNALASAWSAMKDGSGTRGSFEAARQRVSTLTGQPIPPDASASLVASNQSATTGVAPYTGMIPVPSYQQYTSYYCGPATAEDMLRFLGPNQSQTYDAYTHAYDLLTGTTSHDQPILANQAWLQTDLNGGTNWGIGFMQHTLNDWRKIYYYETTPSASLSISQAWIDIDTDVSSVHVPVAENVYYASSTYLPPGFPPGAYLHWDVIFGDDTSFEAGIAQPYGNPRTPWYWEPWALQWSAIAANHGIVW